MHDVGLARAKERTPQPFEIFEDLYGQYLWPPAAEQPYPADRNAVHRVLLGQALFVQRDDKGFVACVFKRQRLLEHAAVICKGIEHQQCDGFTHRYGAQVAMFMTFSQR
ncbi:hypothetical protein D3C72_1849040 [compost metagenome]